MRAAPDRAAFLREACAGDETLRQEIESLLANQSRAAGFLSELVLNAADKRMSDEAGASIVGRQIGTYQIFSLLGARLSPDGRWLAYASNESGRFEVYVRPFAGSEGKWQISADGGREPVWAHSGREVFYRNGEKMMVAEVATQPTFQAATSRLLFEGPYERTKTISPGYDVTTDDQRFVMVQQSEQQSPATDFNVVLNWFEELKRRVSPK